MKKTRDTNETKITMTLEPYGTGQVSISTGIGFFDHMLEQLAYYAGWDMKLEAKGDLEVDEHHLVEDVAIVLGQCIDEFIQGRYKASAGFQRFGQNLQPMDETLVLVSIDLCNRSNFVSDLSFSRQSVGQISTEMIPHFFKTLCTNGRLTLHLKQIWSENTHHLIEAVFKGTGRALKEALTPQTSTRSTKGVL